MRIAVISDIHSNLEALTKALETIDGRHVERIVCLGDIVGYGANPNECIEVIRERSSIVLLGNHDAAALDLSLAQSFTAYARVSTEWTTECLSPEHKEYLGTLPMTESDHGAFLVHASPFEPEEWHYILGLLDARMAFNYFSEEICFVGHSHVPGVFGQSSHRERVEKGERFVVNVGSVGQPRDGNPMLSFGIFDLEKWEYENVRTEYDVKSASEKILKAGLPAALAERLWVGM